MPGCPFGYCLGGRVGGFGGTDENAAPVEENGAGRCECDLACGGYAVSLPHKVRGDAVRPIFESMVELSDHGNLLNRFLALPLPRMFMCGEQNRSLSYLPRLADEGVELAGISHSAHFPMYSNPVQMCCRITDFVLRTGE